MPPWFREIPPLSLVENLLSAFSLKSLSDITIFTRDSIVLTQLEENLPLLEPYYVPCKAKEYIYGEITNERAIVILRQLLKAHNFILKSTEKVVNGKKQTWYQIQSSKLRRSSTPIPSSDTSSICIEFN